MLMTKHLVAHASRWMMVFHDSFLNKSAAVSTLTRARQDILLLTSRARTTHRPRFARRRPPYGAAFASAARALRYATECLDIQYIYMLPSAQCRVVQEPAPRTSDSTTFAHALAMEAVVIDVGSLPVEHAICHTYLPYISRACGPWLPMAMIRRVCACCPGKEAT